MFDMQRLGILGRPNVGKSTLFNLLTGTKNAIVRDFAGVTRDLQIGKARFLGREFEVVDTGGLTEATDEFSVRIREKVLASLHELDCLLLVVDGRAGLCPEDTQMIRIAQQSGKDFAILVNKVDDPAQEEMAKAEFYTFGAELFATSFEHRRGISEALEWALARIRSKQVADDEMAGERPTTIAIIGKPNAGKSSLTNQLLGSERMIVSPIAGTTIDAIDTEIEYQGERFVLIDTAGLRKKRKVTDDIERIANYKALDSIRRADIVLLLVDALLGPSDQDAKLLERILLAHKAVILVANKADIGSREVSEFRKGFRAQAADVFHFYQDLPICFISAKTGYGIQKLFACIADLSEKLTRKIPTSALNRFFMESIRKAPAPVYGHRDVKFYYLTQTQQRPPSFIAFVNHPDGVTSAYRRFLSKNLKKEFDLAGVPIRIFAMKKPGGKSKKSQAYADQAEVRRLEQLAAEFATDEVDGSYYGEALSFSNPLGASAEDGLRN